MIIIIIIIDDDDEKAEAKKAKMKNKSAGQIQKVNSYVDFMQSELHWKWKKLTWSVARAQIESNRHKASCFFASLARTVIDAVVVVVKKIIELIKFRWNHHDWALMSRAMQ